MEQDLWKQNASAMIDYHGQVFEIICQRSHGSHAFSIFQGANPLELSFTVLLLDMAIVLVLSNIMRFLLKPLKQPKVISDVLAGIILGPSVLGHNETFAKNVIPDNSRFIIRNIGIIGFMFFLFLTGVKMDVAVITKVRKKLWVIASGGILIPYIIIFSFVIIIKHFMHLGLINKSSSTGAIASAIIITAFPVIYSVLRDMQLLSSEIGRVALTIAIIGDVFGLSMVVTFEALKQGEKKMIYVLYYLLALVAVSGLVLNGIPHIMKWIVRRTPKGKLVDQNYVIATLLGVFFMGFTTDFIGAAIGSGPIWLGLAIPDGPPIGETIVQKTEVILNDILMPFAYATIGLQTDVFQIWAYWASLIPLFTLVFSAIFVKLVAVVLVARFMEMTYRDSFTLGFMLSLRGESEFFICLHWMDLKIIDAQSFSLIVILIILMTSIACPIINYLYDPTRPYLINKKRTIQHRVQESELRILACIYDQESVANLFSLVDFINPTTNNPFTVFALHLVELLGRAAPVFINHTKYKDVYRDNNNEAVHKAINHYEKARRDCITMNFFTSVTPNRTMYRDICEIALLNKVELIILPFHKKCIENRYDFSTAIRRVGVQSTNANTLSHAPCSVGILACKNVAPWGTLPTRISYRVNCVFALLFLGGPDAREALSLVSRMVEHPNVSLIVVRFLANEYEGYEKSERKMDDGVITWFWVKNERNDKVVYKEVVVRNGFDTVLAIKMLNDSAPIDLWITGRNNGINPIIIEGLSEWSENPELGLLGDVLVSLESGSVLVVQQQVLRNHRVNP
ncbi:cation/H(+) antiporter 24-like [Chenopodium quinoa]|uniref:cation/H(+) antiporter 24-like n=1 Tax=Chenopodium quinoa TaxID=63459 RepID=UPI000B79327B|nr:cation/H(+) antiporter 24-like [Chenopodium quinoa]